MVFDNLRVTRGYNGYMLFLEEDHYVAPDFIQVARQLIRLKEERCPDCDFINMGMYNKVKVLNNRVRLRSGSILGGGSYIETVISST